MPTILDQARKLSNMDASKRRARKFPKTPKDLYKVIGYTPRPLQAELEKHERRFNAEIMHRRFGKTVCKVIKLLERAAFCPFSEGRYAYAAPTYSMAEDIAWAYIKLYHSRFLSYLGEEDATAFQNNSKLFVNVPTKYGGTSRIRLYGVDNHKERLRGMYLDGIVLDEWALIPPSVWSEQIRPMLSDEGRSGEDEFGRLNQWADFIFTPKGRNHAYTTYERARKWYAGEAVIVRDDDELGEVELKRDDWFAALYRASETKYVKEHELKQAKADMGQSRYDQEFECSFEAH